VRGKKWDENKKLPHVGFETKRVDDGGAEKKKEKHNNPNESMTGHKTAAGRCRKKKDQKKFTSCRFRSQTSR
jgi:hypothetical protein